MFGSQILDVAIAMSLFYLFISLICTALREGIEAFTKARAMNLERGIRELLNDPDGTTITKALFDHPQLSGLFAGTYDPSALKKGFSGIGPKLLPNNNMGRWARGNLPSYVPASNFAIALLDVTAKGAVNDQVYPQPQGQILSLGAVRNSVASLPNSVLQRAVLSAVDRANGDLAQAQKNLEEWFNSSMDRVSGWYKRRTQLILFLLGLAAAIFLNLDTFAAFDVVTTNKSIRDGLVAAADVEVKNAANGADKDKNSADQMKTLAQDFQQLNLPMGWRDAGVKGTSDASWFPHFHPVPQEMQQKTCPAKTSQEICFSKLSISDLLKMILGWLITAAAVTLGAPFWFDTLGRFVSLRSSLKPDANGSPPGTPPAAAPAGGTAPAPSPAPGPQPPPFTANAWTAGDPQEGAI